MKSINLTGKVFGRLTVVKRVENSKKGEAQWECRCSCSNVLFVASEKLRKALVESCGCLKVEQGKTPYTKHGLRDLPEYDIWNNMKRRCHIKTHHKYKDYGARGIEVCDEWYSSFTKFYEDMGPRPSPDHSLERKDNNKGYFKENCKWATREDQQNNRRITPFYLYNGVYKSLTAHCRDLGIDRRKVYSRIYHSGMSFEDAVNAVLKTK